MGGLLEALWGYFVNQTLQNVGGEAAKCELVWLTGHEYNDFACVERDMPWYAEDRTGELLRIEAKSMNIGADESKGHFDELITKLGEWDLLLVLLWSWEPVDEVRVSPQVHDYFVGLARPVAALRDRLHIARGSSFVDKAACPDGCSPDSCPHHGEPLNAAGKRERGSGPKSTRPSATSSYAANFGGLVRMLKTNSERARTELRQARADDAVAHAYISFIHRNFPAEEENQYLPNEWRELAGVLGIRDKGLSKADLVKRIRDTDPEYREKLRELFPSSGRSSTERALF